MVAGDKVEQVRSPLLSTSDWNEEPAVSNYLDGHRLKICEVRELTQTAREARLNKRPVVFISNQISSTQLFGRIWVALCVKEGTKQGRKGGRKDSRKEGEYSREGDGEVEPLPQASEGDEGLSGEAAGGHLTVGLLVLPWRTLAHEATREPVDALAAVFAHTRYTPAWWCIQLTVLAYKEKRRLRSNKNIWMLTCRETLYRVLQSTLCCL